MSLFIPQVVPTIAFSYFTLEAIAVKWQSAQKSVYKPWAATDVVAEDVVAVERVVMMLSYFVTVDSKVQQNSTNPHDAMRNSFWCDTNPNKSCAYLGSYEIQAVLKYCFTP